MDKKYFYLLFFMLSLSFSASFSHALITGDAVFGTNKVYVSKTYNTTSSAYYPQTIFVKANESVLFIPGAYKNIILDGISTRIRFHGAVFTGNTRLVSFEVDGVRAYIPYSGSPVYVNTTFYPKRFRLMQITGTGNSAVLQMLPIAKDPMSVHPQNTIVNTTTPKNTQTIPVQSTVTAPVSSQAQPTQVFSMRSGQKRFFLINGKNVSFEVVSINKNQNGEPDTAVFRINYP